MNIKQGIRQGLIILAVLFYLDVIGLPTFIGESALVGLAVIVGLFSMSFVRKDHQKEPKSILQVLVYSLTIGLVSGVGFALVTFFFARLQGQGIKVDEVFAEIKPQSTALLTGMSVADVRSGASVVGGLIKLALYLAGGSLIGGLLAFLLSGRGAMLENETGQKVKSWGAASLPFVFYLLFLINRSIDLPFLSSAGQTSPGRQKWILVGLVILMVLILPQLANLVQNAVMGKVMIFIVMGIGLNIVVGYAGLLDLGYVAFFAVGAYAYGLLSAPESFFVVSLPPTR